MKPAVFRHPEGCWHIGLRGGSDAVERCYATWWDAYHDALYVYAKQVQS